MPFVARGGSLAGEYDAVLILSDFEPDDVIALKLLAPRLRGTPILLVTGEGNVDKAALGGACLGAYGLDEGATVLQGRKSELDYPLGAFSAYPAQHKATVLPTPEPAAATAACEAFLKGASAPLALVLKPPHELVGVSADVLGRTACAAYGSFNLAAFREVLGGDAADAAWEAQEALLGAFKRCVLVERSSSVGRDAILCRAQADIWPHLATDAALVGLLQQWGRTVVHNHARSFAALGAEMTRALEAADGAADAFARAKRSLERIDKRVAIISAVIEYEGLQTPLADPLVVAALCDDDGALDLYVARVRLGHADGKLTTAQDASGSTRMLLAESGRQRALLDAANGVLAKLCAALESGGEAEGAAGGGGPLGRCASSEKEKGSTSSAASMPHSPMRESGRRVAPAQVPAAREGARARSGLSATLSRLFV